MLLLTVLATWTAVPRADRVAVTTDQPAVLNDVPLTQYRAFRRMYATNEKFNQEAWLEAWTEFDETGFRYEIVSERGSEYVRNKVLRNLLHREQQLIDGGEANRAELSLQNYVFEEPAAYGNGVRYITLKPKRKDMLLVNGRMVLNQDGTELLRVEGVLSKNPSFWTSVVNVIRDFARLDGVRVPVTTESIAKIKFAGLSRMSVRYEYRVDQRPPRESVCAADHGCRNHSLTPRKCASASVRNAHVPGRLCPSCLGRPLTCARAALAHPRTRALAALAHPRTCALEPMRVLTSF